MQEISTEREPTLTREGGTLTPGRTEKHRPSMQVSHSQRKPKLVYVPTMCLSWAVVRVLPNDDDLDTPKRSKI